MGIRCFLLERVNEVVTQHEADCTDRDDCYRCRPWESVVFDVRRADTGLIVATNVTYIGHTAEVGAMWFATTLEDHRPRGRSDYDYADETEKARLRQWAKDNPDYYGVARWGLLEDGLPARQPSYTFDDSPTLHVITPGGLWNIDSRASNCTMPYDYDHRCWVRHGQPPMITVDKQGVTCTAGGGSIQCGDFHGFLRDGELVT